jgi:hypothetical protein
MGANICLDGRMDARPRQRLDVVAQRLNVITWARPGDLSRHVRHQMAGSKPAPAKAGARP